MVDIRPVSAIIVVELRRRLILMLGSLVGHNHRSHFIFSRITQTLPGAGQVLRSFAILLIYVRLIHDLQKLVKVMSTFFDDGEQSLRFL